MDPTLLPSLAWFALVAHHRSFAKAAAEAGVSRAALSQNLKALEQRLDAKLLYRTTRSMSLTEAGQRLFDSVQPALNSIDLAVRSLDEVQQRPSGLLRINTSHVAARMLLEPLLGEFLAQHPQLRVELVVEDGLSNIVADGCDAGIRLGESLAPHVVAVPITSPIEMAVVGSPTYFARHGVPKTPAELVTHNCICYRQASSGAIFRWEFTSPKSAEGEGRSFDVEPQGSLVTNDEDGMVRAALQGVGLAQHLEIALRRHLDDGSLVRVLDDWCKPFPGFYLYVPSREQMPAKVRALMDFLVAKRDAMAAPPGKRGSRSTARRR